MAHIGHGYGSEYQLMRFLGHHRYKLNNKINKKTKLKGELYWLDYPYDSKKLSLDGEYEGMKFMEDKQFQVLFKEVLTTSEITNIQKEWGKYWSKTGKKPNLDGIIIHKNQDKLEIVIVEAKAHLGEIKSSTNSASNVTIKKAFSDTQANLKISNPNWFGDYYQLANRLALINFLRTNSVKQLNASLLYIYFRDGYEEKHKEKNAKGKSVKKKKDWKSAINKEYSQLGLTKPIIDDMISKIFLKCVK